MKKPHVRGLWLLVLGLSVGAGMLPVAAGAGISCHKINAKGVGQDTGPFATSAVIKGGGLLNGTTTAAFTPTGFAFPIATFEGSITFTVNKGTLTSPLSGSINVVTREFSATTSGPLSGTGKLAGATGTLTFAGSYVSDTSFVETITGQICVDLSP